MTYDPVKMQNCEPCLSFPQCTLTIIDSFFDGSRYRPGENCHFVKLQSQAEEIEKLKAQQGELVDVVRDIVEEGDLGPYDSKWYENVVKLLTKIKNESE